MTIRPNSLQALVGLTVLFGALAVLTSAAGETSPYAIGVALVLLGVIGVRALRTARGGRVSGAAQEARPHATYEPVGSLTLGLIVLGWTVVAVVVMVVIALVSLALELEGEAASIAGLLTLGSFVGILIAGPTLTLRYLMRRPARR